MRDEDTYEAKLNAILDEWEARCERVADELEAAVSRSRTGARIVAPFVRTLRGEPSRTWFGRFCERVAFHYTMLRLERKLARARMVRR